MGSVNAIASVTLTFMLIVASWVAKLTRRNANTVLIVASIPSLVLLLGFVPAAYSLWLKDTSAAAALALTGAAVSLIFKGVATGFGMGLGGALWKRLSPLRQAPQVGATVVEGSLERVMTPQLPSPR